MTPIGFLRHNFLPPSETFIYGTLRTLERFHVRVFALERHQAEKFPYDDVTVLRDRRLGWLEEALYRTAAWSPQFFAWARTIRLLHAHMGWTGVHGLLARKRLGIPLVTSFYGQDVTLRESRKILSPAYWHYGLLAPALFRHGDRFLVLSEHMQSMLVQRGCPADKIRIVRLGVDTARFAGHARRPGGSARTTVLMVGREVEKKGFDDGLRACAHARDAGADLEVVLLGTGDHLQPGLRRLAEQLRLEVSWPQPSTPVPQAMAQADILLVPSRTARNGDMEGTPTVICEGGAACLPVVSTRHAGIPEQVEHGVTGLLAAEGDEQGLAEHVLRLAREPELRAEMGRAGRAKMEREYSYAAHARTLQAIYDELLGVAAPRSLREETT